MTSVLQDRFHTSSTPTLFFVSHPPSRPHMSPHSSRCYTHLGHKFGRHWSCVQSCPGHAAHTLPSVWLIEFRHLPPLLFLLLLRHPVTHVQPLLRVEECRLAAARLVRAHSRRPMLFPWPPKPLSSDSSRHHPPLFPHPAPSSRSFCDKMEELGLFAIALSGTETS